MASSNSRGRRRRLPSLGLSLHVSHPASRDYSQYGREAAEYQREDEGKADADGHLISYWMDSMPFDDLAHVMLRRGMSARTAADLLRKLADLIDRHGSQLLVARQGRDGEVVEGELHDAPGMVEYDDYGDPIIPDALKRSDGADDAGVSP